MCPSSAFLALPMWLGMLSLVKGMYFAPDVVPLVLQKYRGRPGQSTSSSPFTARSTYGFNPS